MKRILPLLVLCLLLTGCMALPATAPAEPMYLALTFDDGPSPQYTPRLLDGLKQRGVHATFFLIGQQVQDYPELVQRIRAEGHQIGNHTYDHAPLDRLSCGEAMADLSRCDGVLQELAGEGTYWVRPPYGFITEEELAGMEHAHAVLVCGYLRLGVSGCAEGVRRHLSGEGRGCDPAARLLRNQRGGGLAGH